MNKIEKALLWSAYLVVLGVRWLMPKGRKMTKEQKRAYLAGKAAGKKEQKKSGSRKEKKK